MLYVISTSSQLIYVPLVGPGLHPNGIEIDAGHKRYRNLFRVFLLFWHLNFTKLFRHLTRVNQRFTFGESFERKCDFYRILFGPFLKCLILALVAI